MENKDQLKQLGERYDDTYAQLQNSQKYFGNKLKEHSTVEIPENLKVMVQVSPSDIEGFQQKVKVGISDGADADWLYYSASVYANDGVAEKMVFKPTSDRKINEMQDGILNGIENNPTVFEVCLNDLNFHAVKHMKASDELKSAQTPLTQQELDNIQKNLKARAQTNDEKPKSSQSQKI